MDTFDYFIGAFKSILTTSLSAESLRTLALYITYAIYRPESRDSVAVRPARIGNQQAPGPPSKPTISNSSFSTVINQPSPSRELSPMQIALRILDLYSDLLCRANDTGNIKKFARTVTNKVYSLVAKQGVWLY